MKVLILGDHATSHVIKWAKSLSNSGVEICIFSLSDNSVNSYEDSPNIRLESMGFTDDTFKDKRDFLKIKYLSKFSSLRSLIRSFKPDIVHAHYATSYGLLGGLCGFHPYILSVWGSDVYDFPRISFLHRALLKFNLKKADKILSTSHVMAKETLRYIKTDIEVTPFGIDLHVFKSSNVKSLFDPDDIVVGTIKTLEEKYGIQYLIGAFEKVWQKHPEIPLKLLIVGGGTQESYLRKMVEGKGMKKDVVFTGKIPFEEVPNYHNMLDIYVAASTLDSESFGVAIIEASACEKPVIVTNVGGLPEVVLDGVTGFVVPNKDVVAISENIERLVMDKELRIKIGQAGRQRVKKLYDWNENVNQMIGIYKDILK